MYLNTKKYLLNTINKIYRKEKEKNSKKYVKRKQNYSVYNTDVLLFRYGSTWGCEAPPRAAGEA